MIFGTNLQKSLIYIFFPVNSHLPSEVTPHLPPCSLSQSHLMVSLIIVATSSLTGATIVVDSLTSLSYSPSPPSFSLAISKPYLFENKSGCCHHSLLLPGKKFVSSQTFKETSSNYSFIL